MGMECAEEMECVEETGAECEEGTVVVSGEICVASAPLEVVRVWGVVEE